MKFSSQVKQLRLDLFSTTLEKSLDPSNRWYKLAHSMPWDKIEVVYNKRLDNKHCGGGNKPARMVIGALVIKTQAEPFRRGNHPDYQGESLHAILCRFRGVYQ